MKERRKTLLTLTGISALAVWHKPIINQVVIPAHAQTSMSPNDVCSMIAIGNISTSSVSGVDALTSCTATFEVLSADAATPLTIISIDNNPLATDVTIDIQDLGTATDSMGPRVTWRGPSSEAPSCNDLQPTNDVTFTVTATCSAAVNIGQFTQTFSLSSILMS